MTTRRDLFALGGLAALGSIGPVEAANIDFPSHGLRVSLVIRDGGWQVVVPDFDHMDVETWVGWRPGFAVPYKGMPLEEYLVQVEEICGLRPKAQG